MGVPPPSSAFVPPTADCGGTQAGSVPYGLRLRFGAAAAKGAALALAKQRHFPGT